MNSKKDFKIIMVATNIMVTIIFTMSLFKFVSRFRFNFDFLQVILDTERSQMLAESSCACRTIDIVVPVHRGATVLYHHH